MYEVFHSAVHLIARHDYTPAQIAAWAPATLDATRWAEHMRAINPFVAECDGQVVGYADVQPSGYIDHFFVSGHHPRQGIGTQLMAALHQEAARLGLAVLSAEVSLTAQPFFKRSGFMVVEEQIVVRRGVGLPNALMQKVILSHA
ncbi:acetyltransferase [Salinisphaera sp. T31B1]